MENPTYQAAAQMVWYLAHRDRSLLVPRFGCSIGQAGDHGSREWMDVYPNELKHPCESAHSCLGAGCTCPCRRCCLCRVCPPKLRRCCCSVRLNQRKFPSQPSAMTMLLCPFTVSTTHIELPEHQRGFFVNVVSRQNTLAPLCANS